MIKKIIAALLSTVIMLTMLPAEFVFSEMELNYYVDSSAKPGGDGTFENPFNDIQAAKTEAAKHKKENVNIILRGGEYFINESVVFDEKDSRSAEYPLVVKAYADENVNLIGGKKLDTDKLMPVTDTETLNRIPVEARGKVYSMSLKNSGVEYWGFKQFGTYYTETVWNMPELFVNNEKMTNARWPNEGYSTIGEVLDPGIGVGNRNTVTSTHGATFKYSDDRIARWKNAEDAMLYGYWQWNWSSCNLRVKEIDSENKTISTIDSATYAVTQGQRFMAYNLLEELDSPGEWYIDQKNEILYFYPNCEIENMNMIFSQLSDSIIKIQSCKNVTFKGLNIECGRYDLITLDNDCENIEFLGCNIRNTGGYGAVIRGKNCGIRSSNIYNCGNEGILLQGGKCDNSEYTLSKNYVINCDIHDCGQRLTTAAGIRSQAQGAIITHNKIHEIPAWGIGWGDFETIVEYNEIYNVLLETEDAGAIYAGRVSRARGSRISNNYIHDVYGQEELRSGAYIGIYLDDYLCGIEVKNNIFKNVSTPIYGHHSAQCVVENNIIVNETAQSNGWILWTQGGGESENYSFITSHTGIDWTKEPYVTKFPDAQNMTMDNILEAFDNVIRNNLIVNHEGANIVDAVYEKGTVENNYECDYDPGFVDLENDNFMLKEDSEVFEKIPEFKNLDVSKMGIYDDGERPSETITEKSNPFRLGRPYDKSENVACNDVTFTWNACPEFNVKAYRLTIARDKYFKDISLVYRTHDLETVVKELEPDTTYYWKVEAEISDGSEINLYPDVDGIRSFTTSYYKIPEKDNEVQYRELTDFIKDAENWKKGSNESVTTGGKQVTFKGSGVGGYEGEYTDYNTLYHFGAIFDGGDWKAFAMHANNIEQYGWVHNSHYLVIVKPNAIELHKYPDSFTNSGMIASVEKEISFEDKAVHDIVFGTYVKKGVNHIVFAIDGEVIYNIKDTYKGEKKAPGYFAIYNIGGEMTLTEAVGEIPEISFKERELPIQYDKALDCSVLLKAGEARAYVDEIETQINMSNPDITPIVRENRTLIPVRFVAESIGANVKWNENDKSVILSKEDITVKMIIGEEKLIVNGEEKVIDTAPIIENNITYLPARFVAENFGYDVKYDENTGLVLIYPSENIQMISDDREWWNILNNYIMYRRAESEKGFTNPAWDNGGLLAE